MVACNKRNQAARALPEVHFNGIGTRPRKGAYFDFIFGVILVSVPPPLWLPHPHSCATNYELPRVLPNIYLPIGGVVIMM